MKTMVAAPIHAAALSAPRLRLLNGQVQVVLDIVVLASALVLAEILRFDFSLPTDVAEQLILQLPFVVFVQWYGLRFSGALDIVWRYVGMAEIKVFALASLLSTSCLTALRLFLPDALAPFRLPLSIIVMDAVLAFGGVVCLRFLRRAYWEARERHRHHAKGRLAARPAVLLIGAGAAGVMAVHETRGHAGVGLDICGFVDDDPLKGGAVIAGVRVLGTTADLPRLVRTLAIDHVIVTIADPRTSVIRRIDEICQAIPVRVQKVPSFYAILQGKAAPNHFVDLRCADLLTRAAVTLDEADIVRFLSGKVVMVTGAGGSIGSELARQVARFSPRQLLLVERAEFALFDIRRELREKWPTTDIVALVADVGDRARMQEIFRRFSPQVVAHAAAHKHVPLMEENVCEAVKNNIFGTLTLGEVAGEAGVEAFVMISTDKAVNPTSVMGSTKRICELVVQDLGRRYQTRYTAVRFGNVMGSSGSVIPIFREQIARGGPVTITHPEMKRYFMTIPEAAVLVLDAGAMGEGGEIFVLDMGEPVRIVDLAKRMIELAGYDPEDIAIEYTGLRPGEKLFEELETGDEAITKTRHPKIFIGKIAGWSSEQLDTVLAALRDSCDAEATEHALGAVWGEGRQGARQ